MAETSLDRLAAGKYLLVTTYRKDGTAVPTPVWVVRDGDALGVWTVTDSYKVKRIRNNPSVKVAPCDLRGNRTGDDVAGVAAICSPEETEAYRKLLRRKYGLLGLATLLGSRLRRGADGTIGIRITLAEDPPAS
ncbi:PPOX class F420-dependent oxidoreductase [Actinocorallia longicatena]|uniref:PPOX class F420-dependent oxidoreductase n=1 Tax=Actinocorallia longicatena TaxID=111803 RepID=A0ABP6PYZ6_9ACTN